MEERIHIGVTLDPSTGQAHALGVKEGEEFARGVSQGAASVGLSAERRSAATREVAALTGSSAQFAGPSQLAIAEKRAAAAILQLAERSSSIDDEERKRLRVLRGDIEAMARDEAATLNLAKAKDQAARAIQANAEKTSRRQEIFEEKGSSLAQQRLASEERAARTSLASAQSERRRQELQDTRTSAGRRFALELGGSSLYEKEAGRLQGSPFASELKKGFFGTKDPGEQLSFGGSIGQVGRFTALYGGAYGLLYQLQNAFSAAASEAINFTNAVEDLNLASGRTGKANEELAASLGNIAAAGGLAPSAGVSAGAQAIGLYGVAQGTAEEQKTAAITSVSVATRIAAVGDTELGKTQQDLAGLARSLNLSLERLPGLEDELTYVARNIGRPVSELLPAVASVGTLGAGAGFSAEELFAAIGRVTSTTGQSASGASSSLRQVLSRADDPNFLRKIQEQFGIDTTGSSLRDVFADFAATQPDAKDLNKFSLLFGRGASQQVAQILGGNFGEIQQLAAGAQQAAGTGTGQDVFEQVKQGFGYQLKELGQQILNLGKDLANTGIVDFLGLLVKAALEMVKALDAVVQLFNTLPRPLRSVAFGIIELALAAKVFGAVKPLITASTGAIKSAVIGRVGAEAIAESGARSGALRSGIASAFTTPLSLTRRTGSRAEERAITDILRGYGAGTGTRGIQGPGFITAGAAKIGDLPGVNRLQGLGPGAGLTAAGAGAVAGAIGVAAIIAVGVVKNLVEQDAVRQAIEEGAAAIASAQDAEGAQAGVEAARAAEKRAKGLTETGFNIQTLTGQSAVNALNIGGAKDLQREAAAQVAYGDELKRRFEEAEAAATAANPVNAFTDFTNIETLSASLDDLEKSGYNATERMQAMNQAFEEMTRSATTATTAIKGTISPGEGQLFGVQSGAAANSGVAQALQYARDKFDASRGPFGVGGDNAYKTAAEQLSGVDSTRVQDLVQGVVTSQVATLPKNEAGGTDISPEAAKQIEAAALAVAQTALPEDLPADVRKVLNVSIVAGIRRQIEALATGAEGVPSIASELTKALEGYAGNAQVAGLNAGSAAQGQRAALAEVDQAIALSKEALSSLTGEEAQEGALHIRNAELQRGALLTQVVQAEAAEARLLTEAAQSRLATDDLVGRDALAVQTAADALAAAQTQTDKGLITQAETALNNARAAQAKNLLEQSSSARLASIDPRNQQALTAAAITNARALLRTLTRGSTQYNQTVQQLNDLRNQQRQAAIQLTNSQASAGVAGNDSALDNGAVAIANAQRVLAGTLRGTQAYYDALADLRDTQRQLAQAELAYAADLDRLNSDLTDPVAQANNDLRAAQRQLAADQASGQGVDVIAADQVAVRNAENAAEQAAFQQRFDDARTADQLGRSSHQAYLSYLQNEHDRLSAIANRTRQQQEQLDQVDAALMAANEQLSGMWNIGDIKVPTPYEVRRYVAAQAAVTSGGSGTAVLGATWTPGGGQVINNNTVYIDGTDIAAVEAALRRIIGGSAVSTATSTGRKN